MPHPKKTPASSPQTPKISKQAAGLFSKVIKRALGPGELVAAMNLAVCVEAKARELEAQARELRELLTRLVDADQAKPKPTL